MKKNTKEYAAEVASEDKEIKTKMLNILKEMQEGPTDQRRDQLRVQLKEADKEAKRVMPKRYWKRLEATGV